MRAIPAKSSGGRPLNSGGGVERAVDDAVDDVPATVAGGARGADGGVVRPDGPVVVAERVVGGHRAGERAEPPARPHVGLHEPVEVLVGVVGVGDPGPERVAGVRRQRVDRLARGRRAPGRTSRAACQNRSLKRSRSESARCAQVARRWATAASTPPARRRPGARRRRSPAPRRARSGPVGQRPVRRRDPVPRVLPALVGQPGGVAPLVVDEAVAVAVAGPEHPAERTIHGRRQLLELRRGERAPPPRLRREHDEQRRRVDGAVVALAGREGPAAAVSAELVEDLARLLLGRRDRRRRPAARPAWRAHRRRACRRRAASSRPSGGSRDRRGS